MSLEIKQGNLLAADTLASLDAIGHGVNCMGVMGAGIALQIAQLFPEMEKEYKQICKEKRLAPGSFWKWMPPQGRNGIVVYNLATQDFPGAHASYYWLNTAVKAMLKDAEAHSIKRIGIPRIGAGIGGLNPTSAEGCIRVQSWNTPVELIMYDYTPGETK